MYLFDLGKYWFEPNKYLSIIFRGVGFEFELREKNGFAGNASSNICYAPTDNRKNELKKFFKWTPLERAVCRCRSGCQPRKANINGMVDGRLSFYLFSLAIYRWRVAEADCTEPAQRGERTAELRRRRPSALDYLSFVPSIARHKDPVGRDASENGRRRSDALSAVRK